jgi:hypothetical protein
MVDPSLRGRNSASPARSKTVQFELDGSRYEVVLEADEAQRLRKSLRPFVAAARVVPHVLDESAAVGTWASWHEGHLGYAVPEFSDGAAALEWRYEYTPRDQVLVDEPNDGLEATRSVAEAVGWRVACLCGGLGEPIGGDWVGVLVRRTASPTAATSEVHFVPNRRVLDPPAEVVTALRAAWWEHHGRVASLIEEWQCMQADLLLAQQRIPEVLRELEAAAIDLTTMSALPGYVWSAELAAWPHAYGDYLVPAERRISSE